MGRINYSLGHKYINQFDKRKQAEIIIDIVNALVEIDHVDDLQSHLNDALDSRLGDLIDLIDIEKYMIEN